VGTRDWWFSVTLDARGSPLRVRLFHAVAVRIVRHVKVRSGLNPYRAELDPVSVRLQSGRIKIPEGVTMSNLKKVLQQVRDERKQAELRVEKLDEVIHGLVGLNSSAPSRKGAGRSRTLSASARRRISLAQKARWARVRAGKVVSITGKRGKSTISAAGRKRIAAAQRARWAKVRAARKAA